MNSTKWKFNYRYWPNMSSVYYREESRYANSDQAGISLLDSHTWQDEKYCLMEVLRNDESLYRFSMGARYSWEDTSEADRIAKERLERIEGIRKSLV